MRTFRAAQSLFLFAMFTVAIAAGQAQQEKDASAKPKESAEQPKSKTAREPSVQLISPKAPVSLSGRIAGDSSLSQRITLMADQEVPELLFRPSDLDLVGGAEVIPSSQVQLVSPASGLKTIKPNTPLDVDFKVIGVKVPGKYAGVITFLQPDHGLNAALSVELHVIALETPKLSPRTGSTNLKIQLVNCVPYIGCPIRNFIFGQPGDHNFTLDNSSMAPFELNGAAAASGDSTRVGTGTALVLGLPMAIPALPIVTIPLTVTDNALSPDHYVGDVKLQTPGKDEPLKIPLELNVKSGPEMPILVLLIGILFGRFIKYMRDKGVPQSDLLRQLLQVQARAAQDPQNVGLLQHMLEQIRTEIDAMQLDAAKADLALVNSRLTLLSRLRYLETLLSSRSGDSAVAAILANIKLARDQISLGSDPQPIATQIDAQVKALQVPAIGADPSLRAIEVAASSSVRGAAPFTVPESTHAPPKPRMLRGVISFITGHSDSFRADLTLWFLRPLAWAVLVILLVVTGFIQLYTKNATFGTDVISDYFGLFVWATGSDVASRTLSSFKSS